MIAKQPTIRNSQSAIKPAPVFNFSLRAKYIILASIAFLFYVNSIFNNYAFDDNIAIEKNAYVKMGFAGIPKILTNDSWASFYSFLGATSKQQLPGGRYRPLSEIIFAIEQQFFGNSSLLPHISHFVNVLAYMACVIVIFYFLENFLFKRIPSGSDISFLSALLFTIHPLHTEVVANIKSLDEILSMLFIMLTFIFSLKYLQNKKPLVLGLSLLAFFLALLSKEYAVTLVFFIPFIFYSLENKKPFTAITASVPYLGVLLLYLVLRYNAVGLQSPRQSPDILTNPYFYATHIQKIATEWYALGKYLVLLFFPYPLSCDYSYNQIPYHNFSNFTVILSIIIYSGIVFFGGKLVLKKHILSFAILFFLVNIILISNFVMYLGTIIGERLVFHTSLGFTIILSYFLLQVVYKRGKKYVIRKKKNTERHIPYPLFLIPLIIVCLGETVIRNSQWKNDSTLFVHDVAVCPNSFLLNAWAGDAWLRFSQLKDNPPAQTSADFDSAGKYLRRAIYFFPNFDAAQNDLGSLFYLLGQPDSAKNYWDNTTRINPNYPGLKANLGLLSQSYFAKGLDVGMKNGKPREGIYYMEKALLNTPPNAANIWYNIGGAWFTLREFDSAKYAWTKTLQNNPDSADARDAKRGLQAIEH